MLSMFFEVLMSHQLFFWAHSSESCSAPTPMMQVWAPTEWPSHLRIGSEHRLPATRISGNKRQEKHCKSLKLPLHFFCIWSSLPQIENLWWGAPGPVLPVKQVMVGQQKTKANDSKSVLWSINDKNYGNTKCLAGPQGHNICSTFGFKPLASRACIQDLGSAKG